MTAARTTSLPLAFAAGSTLLAAFAPERWLRAHTGLSWGALGAGLVMAAVVFRRPRRASANALAVVALLGPLSLLGVWGAEVGHFGLEFEYATGLSTPNALSLQQVRSGAALILASTLPAGIAMGSRPKGGRLNAILAVVLATSWATTFAYVDLHVMRYAWAWLFGAPPGLFDPDTQVPFSIRVEEASRCVAPLLRMCASASGLILLLGGPACRSRIARKRRLEV